MASVNRSSGLQWSWLVLSVAGELLNALTWKEVVSNQVQLIFHPAHPAPTTLTSPSSPLPLLFHSTCACPHPPSLPLHGLSISQFQSGRAISPAITTLSRPLLPHPLSMLLPIRPFLQVGESILRAKGGQILGSVYGCERG